MRFANMVLRKKCNKNYKIDHESSSFLAFRTFDKDRSGQVDFKEFLSAINIMSNGTPEQKLEWAFRMYDIDGSGTIEEEEMVKIMQVSMIDRLMGLAINESTPTQRAI